MLERIVTIAGGAIVALAALFFVADRPITELYGYFRAGASVTMKTIEEEIPCVVHQEKAATELAAARERLVDRQVRLNLSQNQVKNFEHEIANLQDAISDRKQVLASAYHVLEEAVGGGDGHVTFISTNFSLQEFQHEIDDLLSMQQRDENTLRIKQVGYDRLRQSVSDGATALASMKHELLEIEQEFTILKTRCDHARMESETLDLIARATSTSRSSTDHIGMSIDRLEGQVEQLEARNAARRHLAPVSERSTTGKLTKSFNRLAALKRYAEASKNGQAADESKHPQSQSPKTSMDATGIPRSMLTILGVKHTRAQCRRPVTLNFDAEPLRLHPTQSKVVIDINCGKSQDSE